MLCLALPLLVLGSGTVRLTVVDEHGKPLENRTVWLAPTNSTKALRSFGNLWSEPGVKKFGGRSDRFGRLTISGVPKNKPMMVITTFGPRFDPYLKKQENHRDYSVDVIKLEGAVYSGRPARAVVAEDFEISGRVTNRKGSPMAGVKMCLQDTMYGHMSGYPLTELDSTVTDQAGNYRFSNLPNCAFTVTAQPKTPTAVEHLTPKRTWEFVSVDAGEGLSGFSGAVVNLKKPKARCDFRVSKPATATVVIRRESGIELKGWTVNIGGSGWLPGYAGFDKPEGAVYTWHLLPGTYHVLFTRDSDEASVDAGTLTLGEGEAKTLQVQMSEVLRRVRRVKKSGADARI